jgi:hypothetical protein
VTIRGQAILELLAHDQGENEQKMWPRMVSSYLWKIGRVASSSPRPWCASRSAAILYGKEPHFGLILA